VPALAGLVAGVVRGTQAELGADYVIQPGKCVVELVMSGADKGQAVRAFMAEPPFRGRVPIYLGDDLPDERAFAVVNELGGHSMKVGDGPTIARWRLPDVRAVKRWLTGAVSLAAR
jgi:trehalose 6-phosphate phosphatase